jgi:hypothetical protein
MEEKSRGFELLVCGNTSDNMFEFKDVMNTLNSKIKRMTEFVVDYDWNNGNANIYIPFYCRNILESVMTALLGRFDPFRLLIVYKVQSNPEYDLGKRAQVAVEWTGDIIAKNAPKSKPWSFENKIESFERAILGNYYGEIVWKPAFGKLIDFVSENGVESQWLDEIVSMDEKQNFEKAKSTAMRLFSSFSKGVHSECLVDINIVMDEMTIRQLVEDLFKLCNSLSLASHFVDFTATKIEISQALDIFLKIEEMISNE